MPESFGVKRQGASVNKRSDAVFFRFRCVFFLVQFFNPPGTGFGFFKIKSPVLRIRLGSTLLKLVSTKSALGLSFLSVLLKMPRCSSDTASTLLSTMTLANST